MKNAENSFNKKLLIYVANKDLKPTGGAAGYNYNLHTGLQQINADNYAYISNVDAMRNKMKSLKNSKFKTILFALFRIINYYRVLHKRKHYAKVDISQYEVVHFHNVKDVFEAKDSLENYKGLVILTSHTPKPFTYEIYEDVVTDLERKFFGKMFKKLICMEKFAFNRADYIIFPCEQAEEPYYKKWEGYREIHHKNKDKYKYLLTGTRKCNAKISRKRYRANYGIPERAFVISYVGRHNETKGYDQLKILGADLLNDYNNYFLIAGKEEPLKGLKNQNWIEIGWTDDPHSLIASSDVFVLPNKDTYFDLVMLEVLSLGKIVVASNTGGNRFFSTINAPGIFLYKSVEEAKEKIMHVSLLDSITKKKLEDSNLKLFKKMFSTDVFANNYLNLINSLK